MCDGKNKWEPSTRMFHECDHFKMNIVHYICINSFLNINLYLYIYELGVLDFQVTECLTLCIQYRSNMFFIHINKFALIMIFVVVKL